MRILRYGLTVIVVLVVVILFWIFRPLPPSGLKEGLYGHSYLAGRVKIRRLWDRPLSSIIPSTPVGKTALPDVPFFLRPLLPPTVELYGLGSKEGGGWAIAADLGWRSRLFRILQGLIMDQIQYKGIGAIEGENMIRTPAGLRLLVYQDGGTLFIAEGEMPIRRILGPESGSGLDMSIGPLKGLSPQVDEGKDIAYIAFSNDDMEVTRIIEEVEKEIGFLLLPSISSMKGGTVKLRYASGDTLVGEILLTAREGGDIDGIEGDISYLVDLLDRFLSVPNFKVDKTINKEDGHIMAQVMIHPGGGPR